MAAIAVLAVALGVRATIRFRGTPHPPFDPWYHLDLARQWRNGTGLSSSAEIAAGYPLFVAAVDLLRPTFVGLPLALGLTQSLLLGPNVVLTALLGRRVAPPWVGLAAAGVQPSSSRWSVRSSPRSAATAQSCASRQQRCCCWFPPSSGSVTPATACLPSPSWSWSR